MQRLWHTSHNNYVSPLLDPHNKFTKKFWRYIKSMRKEQISINALLSNGETYTDSAVKANILYNQFVSIFTKDDHSPLPIMGGNSISNIEQLLIDVNGVYNLLVNINPHEATRPDGIPSRLLKQTASVFISELLGGEISPPPKFSRFPP